VAFYNLLLLFISGSMTSSSLVFIIKVRAENDDFLLLLFNRETFRLERLLLTFVPIFI
jgi:hypothetical protein